jgi:hypothetical protein
VEAAWVAHEAIGRLLGSAATQLAPATDLAQGRDASMSAPRKVPEGDGELADLAHLADDLAHAIANGDVEGAREAHDAIGHGLASSGEQPAVVVDLARERAKRRQARRKGGDQ